MKFAGSRSSLVCKNCGSASGTRTITKGSFFIEVILWLIFLVPGIIYSIWRLTTRHQACKDCGSQALVPINSPLGKKLLNDINY